MSGMSNVAVDLHDTTMTVAVRDRRGEEITRRKFPTKCVDQIRDFFAELPGPVWCAIESVGMYEWLWDLLDPMGFERFMLADAVELRYRAGRRQAKTDKVDAGFLSLLVFRDEVPESFVPDKTTRDFRRICRHWHNTSSDLSSLKIRLSWILKQHNFAGPRSTTGPSAQKWFLAHGHELSPMAAVTFSQMLESIEHLERQRTVLRRHLIEFSKMDQFRQDIEIIKTVKGIDLIIACIVTAEVADFRRFHSAQSVGCYAGLSERTSESAGEVAPGRISKAGSPALRWVLCEAVNCLIRFDPHAKKIYNRLLKNTATASEAKTAMARKLSGWLWKMVTSGQPYCPGGVKQQPPTTTQYIKDKEAA